MEIFDRRVKNKEGKMMSQAQFWHQGSRTFPGQKKRKQKKDDQKSISVKGVAFSSAPRNMKARIKRTAEKKAYFDNLRKSIEKPELLDDMSLF